MKLRIFAALTSVTFTIAGTACLLDDRDGHHTAADTPAPTADAQASTADATIEGVTHDPEGAACGCGDAGRGDAGRDDAGRDDAGRDDAGRDDAGRDDAGRDDAGRGDAGRGDAGRGDAGGCCQCEDWSSSGWRADPQ